MMMVGARGRSLREPPFVVAVHRSGIALPLTGGVQQECFGVPPHPHHSPTTYTVQTHGAEVESQRIRAD